MATETQEIGARKPDQINNKRKMGRKNGKNSKKKPRTMHQGDEKKVKVSRKMKELFRKRARDYNSDASGEEHDHMEQPVRQDQAPDTYKKGRGQNRYNKKDEFEKEESFSDEGEENEVSEDEDGGIQPGITRFTEGIKAFKMAFKKIVKKTGSDDVLGPVLSAQKKLIAAKLAEEAAERKVKGEAKKEKHKVAEMGHAKPENDAREKFLLGIATKGVVKLFNAVNKAQSAQRGLNPSRTRDEKVIKKRRKEAFFSELSKTTSQTKIGVAGGLADGEGPAWAPLRDNYLTNSKLKDWDKMQDTTTTGDDFPRQQDADSSSDDN